MNFYTPDDYNLTDFEAKLIKVIAKKENYFPTVIGKASDGKTNIHIQTLDARKVTKSISKFLNELNLI